MAHARPGNTSMEHQREVRLCQHGDYTPMACTEQRFPPCACQSPLTCLPLFTSCLPLLSIGCEDAGASANNPGSATCAPCAAPPPSPSGTTHACQPQAECARDIGNNTARAPQWLLLLYLEAGCNDLQLLLYVRLQQLQQGRGHDTQALREGLRDQVRAHRHPAWTFAPAHTKRRGRGQGQG